MYRKILCCFIGIFHNHKSVFQFPLCISKLWFCNTPLAVNPAKDCYTLCILHFSCHPTPPHSNIFTIDFFIDTLNLTKWTSLAKALTHLASIRIPCCHCWPLATISVSKSACGLPLLGIFPPFRKCLPAPLFCKRFFAGLLAWSTAHESVLADYLSMFFCCFQNLLPIFSKFDTRSICSMI